MTVKRLKALLSIFPENMNVVISYDRYACDIEKISMVTDVDTNTVSVDIIAKYNKGVDEKAYMLVKTET